VRRRRSRCVGDSSKLVVAAFECPFDGNYTVFKDTMLVKSVPEAKNDQKWINDQNAYDLKMLTAKTLIRFAVDCVNDCAGDPIEIAWTITAK